MKRFWRFCSPPSSFLGGLLSEELAEEEPLDDDGLAGQQAGGWDDGRGGSGSQGKTGWDGEYMSMIYS